MILHKLDIIKSNRFPHIHVHLSNVMSLLYNDFMKRTHYSTRSYKRCSLALVSLTAKYSLFDTHLIIDCTEMYWIIVLRAITRHYYFEYWQIRSNIYLITYKKNLMLIFLYCRFFNCKNC